MGRRVASSLLLLAVVVLAAAAPFAAAAVGWDNDCAQNFVDKRETPHEPPGAIRLCREGVLAISYDVAMVNPAFAAYYITPQDIEDNIPGRKSFYEDPDLKRLGIKQGGTHCKAYNASWNKGHVAPSRIMSFSAAGKKSTYTMANVAPQQYYFNQNPWRLLEDAIFDWIGANDELHIVTGVAYKSRSKARRSWDNVSVPDYYFVVVCDKRAKKSAGVIATNTDYSHGSKTLVTVGEVEDKYGGQLLPGKACRTSLLDKSYWWEWSSNSKGEDIVRVRNGGKKRVKMNHPSPTGRRHRHINSKGGEAVEKEPFRHHPTPKERTLEQPANQPEDSAPKRGLVFRLLDWLKKFFSF